MRLSPDGCPPPCEVLRYRVRRLARAWRSMTIVGLCVAISLAAAALSDSIWARGMFDAGDHDQLIMAATDGAIAASAPATTVRCAIGSSLVMMGEVVVSLRVTNQCGSWAPPPVVMARLLSLIPILFGTRPPP